MDDQLQRKSIRVYALALALSVSVALFVSLIYSNSTDGFSPSGGDAFREDLLSTKSSDMSISFGTDNAADIQELKQGLGLEKSSDNVVADVIDAPSDSSELVHGLGLDNDPDSAVSEPSDVIDNDALSGTNVGSKAASRVNEFLHFNSDLTAPTISPESATPASSSSDGAQGHSGLSFAHNSYTVANYRWAGSRCRQSVPHLH
jgi:hypothetical protein